MSFLIILLKIIVIQVTQRYEELSFTGKRDKLSLEK